MKLSCLYFCKFDRNYVMNMTNFEINIKIIFKKKKEIKQNKI